MPRPAKPWRRKGRPGWYAEIAGKTVKLAGDDVDFAEATKILHRTIAAERPRVRSDLTVDDACDLWLEHVQATCAQETYSHRVTMLSVVCDALGHHRIDELRASHVEKFLAEAMNQRATKNPRPVSTATKRGYVVLLKTALRWTRDEGHWQGDDPLRKLKTPQRTRRERTLTPEERAKLLAAVPIELRDFLEVLSLTGIRPHIAIELEARHIDWSAKQATVVSKGVPYTLILPEAALAKLTELAKRNPEGPLLRNTRGDPWTRNAIGLNLRRWSVRLGIPRVVAYSYRHSFATDLLEDGVSPATVAALMNHKDLSMLSEYYSHLAKRRGPLRQAAEDAARAIAARGVLPNEPKQEEPPPADAPSRRPARKRQKRT